MSPSPSTSPSRPTAATGRRVERSTARTHAWAERSLAAHSRPDQALFGIVQGGLEPDLREASTRFIADLPFDGICIGGLAGDETAAERAAALDIAVGVLADDPRVRYLMGLGSPVDILEAVHQGIDLFDSVLPTRVARNGQLWIPGGRLNIRNARFADDPAPVQEDCPCRLCQGFSPGLSGPPVPGRRAARVSSRDLSQPDLLPRLHGQDPGLAPGRDLPRRPPWSAGARRRDRHRFSHR